jgi:hypothetical protein
VWLQLEGRGPNGVYSAMSGDTAPNPVVASEDGMVLNFVKPDHVADFEAVVSRVQEALTRQGRALGDDSLDDWQVLRAAEPAADGSIVYVFTSREGVHAGTYDLLPVLNRAYPSDGAALYGRYVRACARQTVVRFEPVTTASTR